MLTHLHDLVFQMLAFLNLRVQLEGCSGDLVFEFVHSRSQSVLLHESSRPRFKARKPERDLVEEMVVHFAQLYTLLTSFLPLGLHPFCFFALSLVHLSDTNQF